MEYYSPYYDRLRNWIRDARDREWSWDEITMMRQSDTNSLNLILAEKKVTDFWPDETDADLWFDVVDSLKKAEERKRDFSLDTAMITDKMTENGVTVPTDPASSWVLYKNHLKASNFKPEAIEEIESATLQILRRLNRDDNSRTVKGLVVGHVQSGKTANMAALMAMAADWHWNMFIVLSGTIENLRKQTQTRLFNDLYRKGNVEWKGLQHLSPLSPLSERSQDLSFDSNDRFFTVCLKNSTRLQNLIKWLQADKNKLSQMKIIVIDDESDQGGINTAKLTKKERSRINKLMVNLVEGNRPNGSKFETRPMAMNYIGYTATPYANFLNESHPVSLYPRSFIRTLQPSNEYFGAKQIFGIEGTENFDGLDIKRVVSEDDLATVKQIHSGELEELPESASDSLAWFLCAAAAMRVRGHKKPISMLVHTSQKQNHHSAVARSIERWLLASRNHPDNLMDVCAKIWERETKQLSLVAFREQFPEYPKTIEVVDYPSFDDIKPEIEQLVGRISHIPMDEDGLLEYHEGIHLCIDNCANNATDESAYVRLAYPEPANCPDPAPVFIVVGGSTLSRGLTIEGLVSTFFLRAANQADSLMQMGRWFGYRRGYELYPRIWMTEGTIEKFEFLAQLEVELRDDLRQFMDAGKDPSEYGPKVKNSPKVSWLRLTSKNKMQNAVEADMDFSGTNIQTVLFEESPSTLQQNIAVAEEFLAALKPGSRSQTSDSIVWRNVDFQTIKDGLLKKYDFHQKASVFNRIEAFCEWFEQSKEEAGYVDWNVVVAGTKVGGLTEDKLWSVPGGAVGKIIRSRKHRENKDGSLNIGVLRAPKDLFEDIEDRDIDESMSKGTSNNLNVRKIREAAGLGSTPLLIIYRIDKESKPNSTKSEQSKNPRQPLDVEHDIIGISIWIPGVKSEKMVKSLTVRIDKTDLDIDDETGETDED